MTKNYHLHNYLIQIKTKLNLKIHLMTKVYNFSIYSKKIQNLKSH